MKMREIDSTTSHINTFSRVLSKLSSQWINFEEKVKALAPTLKLAGELGGILHDIHQQLPEANNRPNPHRILMKYLPQ